MKKKNIAVDFDGTCVKHEYPEIGDDIGAIPVLKKLVERGDRIILFTMRSGEYLDKAVEWFNQHGIPLYGVNKNPQQRHWTTSPKVDAHIYIDDCALGIPLIRPANGDRPFVNWNIVAEMLELS